MDIAGVYSVLLDHDGVIVWTSGLDEHWRGAEVVGRPIWSFCVEEHADTVRMAIQNAVEEQQESCYALIAVTPSGLRQGWLTRVCPTCDNMRAKGLAVCLITSPIALGHAHLTGTEIQILRRMARGETVDDLAKGLDLDDASLQLHLTCCKAKLQMQSDEDLVAYAAKHA